MTRLEVAPAALTAHATRIDAAGARISEVTGAALGSVALEPVAFGLLCSFLVPPVMAQQAQAIRMITALGDAVRAEAGGIRAAARGYQQSDARLAASIGAASEVFE